MNAFRNIAAVQQGKSSVKEQCLIAMSGYASLIRLSHPQFAEQFDALSFKGAGLADAFFEALEIVDVNKAGRIVAAAVQKA